MDRYADSEKIDNLFDQKYYMWNRNTVLILALSDLDIWLKDARSVGSEKQEKKRSESVKLAMHVQ